MYLKNLENEMSTGGFENLSNTSDNIDGHLHVQHHAHDWNIWEGLKRSLWLSGPTQERCVVSFWQNDNLPE